MSTRLLSLEMSTRLLSPSHALKAREEHAASVSGDEHKATLYSLPLILSKQEMSTRLLSLEMSTRLLAPSHSLNARVGLDSQNILNIILYWPPGGFINFACWAHDVKAHDVNTLPASPELF